MIIHHLLLWVEIYLKFHVIFYHPDLHDLHDRSSVRPDRLIDVLQSGVDLFERLTITQRLIQLIPAADFRHQQRNIGDRNDQPGSQYFLRKHFTKHGNGSGS